MKRKIISLFQTCACAIAGVCMLLFSACSLFPSSRSAVFNATTVEVTETLLVIHVDEVQSANTTLLDVMAGLQTDGDFTYTLSGTMLQSINGKENAADWSFGWVLYTSDAEMSNAQWGTYDYQGETYASAILGADALPVLAGATYIWEYKAF